MAFAFQKNGSGFLPRIAQADRKAAQECVNVYGTIVWTLANQSIASPEAAEKAVQEIFVDIWENAAFCDLSVSDEAVWIALIARHRLAQYSSETHLTQHQNTGIAA